MAAPLTLLYTDIEGSTALNARLGDAAMAEVWARHDRGSRDLLRHWHGREIDRSDGFLALFESVTDAAAFAAEYHAMLAAMPVPLRARAGLHLGPLALRHTPGDEVALGAKPLEPVGIGKAVSARLMSLAQGGQTLASPDAATALAAAGWRCHSHGHWRFKGLTQPTEVFELGPADGDFVPPPDGEKAERVLRVNGQWAPARAVPHSLPAERDSFVGRSADLAALGRRLREGARLVTLHGPGGMGKTRLALRYAWGWRGEHPGGLWFCDLSQSRSLDGLLQAVAQGLDVPLSGDPVTQLGRAIAGREGCLLILDNFEQVAAHAANTLGRWLEAAPSARFIATSREVLGLPGEHTLALAPLAGADAVELFHQRAMAAYSGYMPLAVDEAVVEELVEMLDGLPLAIELAAPRVRVMAPEDLLARMGDRFRLLASERGRPERQATLYATLQWSWELLSAAEQSALAQMSVFEGGFDWVAAEAVLSLDPAEATPWLADVLQGLIDKSLLRRLAQRFFLLRSVHEFARLKLNDIEGGGRDASSATLRHLRHFTQLRELDVVSRRGTDLDNLVCACERAVARNDAASAIAGLGLAWTALRLTGPFRAGIALAERVGGMSGLSAEQHAATELVAGTAYGAMGAAPQALSTLRQGLSRMTGESNPVLGARLHCALGEALMASGEADAAASLLETALALARRAEDLPTQCWILNNRGTLAQNAGDPDEAQRCFEAGFALACAAHDLRWQAGLLGNLAALAFDAGDLDGAGSAYAQALALARGSGDRRWTGNSHCNLGLVMLELGRFDDAEVELTRALATARAIGHRALEHTSRCNLGLAALARGAISPACDHLEAALDGAVAMGSHRLEISVRSCLGRAWAAAGRVADARACLTTALSLLQRAGDVEQHGLVMCSLAETEHLAGDSNTAARILADAQALTASLRSRPGYEFARGLERTRKLIGCRS